MALYICLSGTAISADAGVGIMPSQIQVDELLQPGGYCVLPPLQVVNTGDQAAYYAVVITHLQEQRQMQPGLEYFNYSPASFYLEPGEHQVVSLSLNIPLKAEPGDYLAHIEAHPQESSEGVTVSIAAAAKIYFTIKPANIWQAMWVGTNSFFQQNAPLSYIVPLVVLAVVLWVLLRRNFRFEMKIARKRERGK